MTLAYSARFVSFWGVSIVAMPLIPVAFVVGGLSSDPGTAIVMNVFAAFLMLFAAYTRFWPGVKHQIRAGVFPLSLADRTPTTEEDFIYACQNAVKAGKLCVVSHGWSFYLAKMRAKGNRVWTLKYTGRNDNGAWKSGTTIADVKKALAIKGLTLPANPSMEFASLGSWIATCSHGHPGTETVDHEWIETARVLHVETNTISEDGPVQLMAKFGNKLQGTHVVLDVKLAVVEDAMLERAVQRVSNVKDATWWLSGTHVRLMFIGTAGPLGVVWNSTTNTAEGKNMHPHCCSKFCFWFSADCLPTLPGAWLGNLKRFEGYGKLSDANSSINPPFYPIFSIWGQICCVYNLELFVPRTPNEKELFHMVNDIHAFHRKHLGRTELRMDSSTIYFDISLRSVHKFELYFRMLHNKHGITCAAQHSGKYRMSSLLPLTEISPCAAIRPVQSTQQRSNAFAPV